MYLPKKIEDDGFSVKYGFEDKIVNKFVIQFKNDAVGPGKSRLGSSYELAYFVWDREEECWSNAKVVNSDIFKITDAVFGKALPSFLEEKPWVRLIRIEGLAKEGEKEFSPTKRTRLYVRYMSANPVEGYRMSCDVNRISLTKEIK